MEEENGKLAKDPEEVNPELQKISQEQAEARANDPTEMAATVHALYTPKFMEALGNISGQSAKRILKFLVNYPIAQDEIKDIDPVVKTLAHLANQLVECKFIMIMDTYRLNADVLMKAQEEVQLETKEETNGEE